MMRRREFMALLGGAVVAWPVAARAQQPAMPVIAFLNAGSPETYVARLRAFHLGLKETGYVEGDNVAIVYRWAENQLARGGRPGSTASCRADAPGLAAKTASTSIPIV